MEARAPLAKDTLFVSFKGNPTLVGDVVGFWVGKLIGELLGLEVGFWEVGAADGFTEGFKVGLLEIACAVMTRFLIIAFEESNQGSDEYTQTFP